MSRLSTDTFHLQVLEPLATPFLDIFGPTHSYDEKDPDVPNKYDNARPIDKVVELTSGNYFEFAAELLNLMRLSHLARIRPSQPRIEAPALSAGLIAERRI